MEFPEGSSKDLRPAGSSHDDIAKAEAGGLSFRASAPLRSRPDLLQNETDDQVPE